MAHEHDAAGYEYCDCGIWKPRCTGCAAVHVKLHHRRRRRRIKKVTHASEG